jgi:hypothetical protein
MFTVFIRSSALLQNDQAYFVKFKKTQIVKKLLKGFVKQGGLQEADLLQQYLKTFQLYVML